VSWAIAPIARLDGYLEHRRGPIGIQVLCSSVRRISWLIAMRLSIIRQQHHLLVGIFHNLKSKISYLLPQHKGMGLI